MKRHRRVTEAEMAAVPDAKVLADVATIETYATPGELAEMIWLGNEARVRPTDALYDRIIELCSTVYARARLTPSA